MDISENSCYLSVVRPPIKSATHCITGTCQIERVCSSNQHEELEYSIKHSKVLEKYKNKYSSEKVFLPEQAEFLCAQKNITNGQTIFYVSKTLKELHSFHFANSFISKLTKTKYDKKNSRHETMLLQLWKNLKPNQELVDRISDQWISLGFQANDPATDFRGSGYLGLINLHRLSESKLGKKLFEIASSPKTQYFFCSAGIFFSMLAHRLLKQRKTSYKFWVSASEEETLTQFQLVYLMLFNEFNQYWLKKCSDKSIMQFNMNLKRFQEIVLMSDWESLRVKIQKALQ